MTGKRRGRPSAAPAPAVEWTSLNEPTYWTSTAATDVWMYSVDGPRLFEAGEPIPDGYVDTPAKVSDR